MDVSNITDTENLKFNTDKAFKIKTTNIKENKSVSQITFIPWEDINFENCIGKDGKEFQVVSYYKINGENLDTDFLDVFSSKANGQNIKSYNYYINNFVAKITKNFSDSSSLTSDMKSLEKGANDLVIEIKNNNLKGLSNNIENLKTKFNVNGIDFTFKELMDSSNAMDYANSILLNRGSGLDYINYAEMGIAKGKVNTFSELNLNLAQKKLLNDTMSKRVENIINSIPEKTDDQFKKRIVIDKNNEFYSIKNVQAATNKEYAKKIMDIFEKVDYSNIESFKVATKEYSKLIKPVLESAGIKNIGRNHSLTDVTNYEIKKLTSLFDESYKKVILSADEVRKKFGNSKNVIDICR